MCIHMYTYRSRVALKVVRGGGGEEGGGGGERGGSGGEGAGGGSRSGGDKERRVVEVAVVRSPDMGREEDVSAADTS
jgi:hypothetical protein